MNDLLYQNSGLELGIYSYANLNIHQMTIRRKIMIYHNIPNALQQLPAFQFAIFVVENR